MVLFIPYSMHNINNVQCEKNRKDNNFNSKNYRKKVFAQKVIFMTFYIPVRMTFSWKPSLYKTFVNCITIRIFLYFVKCIEPHLLWIQICISLSSKTRDIWVNVFSTNRWILINVFWQQCDIAASLQQVY